MHTSRVTDGVTAQGSPTVNEIPIPCNDEELQDEYEVKNYHGEVPIVNPVVAQDSEAIHIALPPIPKPHKPWYDENVGCACHANSEGVNLVERFTNESLIKDVFKVKSPLAVDYAKLDEENIIEGVHDQCKVCLFTPDQCDEFKAFLQCLMAQYVIQFIKTKNDESSFVIVPIFEKERLPRPLVVSCPRNTNIGPIKNRVDGYPYSISILI
ncbi:hypothetical protein KIW84_061215 [Lathyrus oleraceus]|uniref:Uncharacterized protein n=1 Tax=Pisum sativum TaxID=3888 RepID=A0A9D4W1T9_PEA|nr:hypothetical protein KIW84_061215 [Pisum sativum]